MKPRPFGEHVKVLYRCNHAPCHNLHSNADGFCSEACRKDAGEAKCERCGRVLKRRIDEQRGQYLKRKSCGVTCDLPVIDEVKEAARKVNEYTERKINTPLTSAVARRMGIAV